jgi:hypothetical protein
MTIRALSLVQEFIYRKIQQITPSCNSYGEMVSCILAMDAVGVRFSLVVLPFFRPTRIFLAVHNVYLDTLGPQVDSGMIKLVKKTMFSDV